MLVQAIRIDTDGLATLVDLGTDTLKAFYEHIDCRTVDVVRLPHDIDMWIDDEGSFPSDRVNNGVAVMYGRETSGRAWGPIFGNVVISTTDGEGETIGLDDTQAAQILFQVNQIRAQIVAPVPA